MHEYRFGRKMTQHAPFWKGFIVEVEATHKLCANLLPLEARKPHTRRIEVETLNGYLT